MSKNIIKYSFMTIGLYLGVYYASGAGELITKAASGGRGLITAFQGR